MRVKLLAAVTALTVIVSGCGGNEQSAAPSPSPTSSANEALPETCAEWSRLNVADRYAAISSYLVALKLPKSRDRAVDEDTVAQAVREGCEESEPPEPPRISADNITATW